MGTPIFSGKVYPRSSTPKQILDTPVLPSDQSVIGELSLRCDSQQGGGGFLAIFDTWGDCSTIDARQLLRKEASQAGGDSLVGHQCDKDTSISHRQDSVVTTEKMSCHAQVGRRFPAPVIAPVVAPVVAPVIAPVADPVDVPVAPVAAPTQVPATGESPSGPTQS